MMLKKFIDESEVFAVNENLTWISRPILNRPERLLIVDNFYKNPELVRDLALTIPPSTDEFLASNLPVGRDSGRINISYKLSHIGKYLENIFRDAFPDEYKRLPPNYFFNIFHQATFMCNVMTSNNLPPRVPHCDFSNSLAQYAVSIFLNTDEESAGGTGLYTFAGDNWGNGNSRSLFASYDTPADHYVSDSVGDWELIDVIEMKFNRLIMYPQNQYHSAYIKPGMFIDGNYRINQMFFI